MTTDRRIEEPAAGQFAKPVAPREFETIRRNVKFSASSHKFWPTGQDVGFVYQIDLSRKGTLVGIAPVPRHW